MFEDEELIYVSQRKQWYSPSSCLWTHDTRISDKAAIAAQYPDLEDFFVRCLEVEEPDINTYVKELENLVADNSNPSIDTVKGLIERINSMGPRPGSLKDLQTLYILPVKAVNGHIRLQKTTDVFSIIDRRELEELFSSQVPVLNYTQEEAHELKPFISAMGLDNRCMSRIVRETSDANVASRHSTLSGSMRKKAYLIFR